MRKRILFALSGLLLVSPSFSKDYLIYPFYYFGKGYDYGKCLSLVSERKISGSGIFIPTPNEKVFAYYHFLLTQKGLKPIAIKGGIVVGLNQPPTRLEEIKKILKELKFKLFKTITLKKSVGYEFKVDCKTKPTISKSASEKKKKQKKPKQTKLPIDLVIEDLEKAIKDAQKIGEVEPSGVRTIYQIEFDKERLIRDLQAILTGLKQFKLQNRDLNLTK